MTNRVYWVLVLLAIVVCVSITLLWFITSLFVNIYYGGSNYVQEVLEFLFDSEVLSAISGVILAIIGLFLTIILYNQQKNREDEQNKKRGLLRAIEKQISISETEDLKILLKEILKIPYNQFEEIFDRVYKQEFQEICLYQANKRLIAGQLQESIEIIKDFIKIFQKDEKNRKIADNLHNITKVLEESEHYNILSASEEDVDKIKKSILWLWEEYDRNVHEIVIFALIRIKNKVSLEEIFHEATENTNRLLLDDRLKDVRKKAPLLLYNWPACWPPPTQKEDRSAKRGSWLEENGLTRDPFAVPPSSEPKLLEDAWMRPERWQEIEYPGWIVITSSQSDDLIAAALRLCYEKRTQTHRDVFSALLPLPTHDLSLPASHEQRLEAIAHAIAATWIDLLAQNPGALIDLPEPDAALLVAFLTWASGSGQRLLLQLEEAGLGKEQASARYLRRLCGEFSQSLWQGAATVPRLRSWLRLRPPGLEATYLIAYPSSPWAPTALQAEAQALLAMAESLHSDGVHLKLFAPPFADAPPHKVELAWSPDDLQKMLADRITRAYGPESCKSPTLRGFLVELEKLPDISAIPDFDALISRKAQVSLSRMLELAGNVIDGYRDGKKIDELWQEINTT